jgi:hypothetical protein
LISIGTHITIGGIGQVIHISIWDSIIGIHLDFMDKVWDGLTVGITEDGHLINGVIPMDGTTTMVGIMEIIGIEDIEMVIM